jgi:DNA-binding transcriptional MerR regulator
MQNRMYMVSDLVRETGISKHSIYHYMKIGLIEESYRAPNNYCFFDERQLQRLRRIRGLRLEGYPLKLIGRKLREEFPQTE